MLYPKHFVGQALLIYSPPEVMLPTIDSDEHFIDAEGVAVSSVVSLQSPGIQSTELDAP